MKKCAKTLYLVSAIFFLLFVVFLIWEYLIYRELLLQPLVMVAPFSHNVKRLFLYLLLPSFLCAILGFITSKKQK